MLMLFTGRGGMYEYSNGIKARALLALGAGVVVALSGLILPGLQWLYDYSWSVGFLVTAVVYLIRMQGCNDTRRSS